MYTNNFYSKNELLKKNIFSLNMLKDFYHYFCTKDSYFLR